MDYTVREVEALLGVSRAVVKSFVEAGFLAPTRGARREYRFSFQDLVVLRTAQSLSAAKIPSRKIARSLKRLRQELPDRLPLAGLRITALGDDIVVREGAAQWQAESGQYLLDFEVAPNGAAVRFLAGGGGEPARTAEDWFDLAYSLEERDPERARVAYASALAADPAYLSAYVNLGRLLHAANDLDAAHSVYREGLRLAGEDALLHYNLGVLLEDMHDSAAAIACYEAALRVDAGLADAHFNLARLRDASGRVRDAVRHYNEYRRLQPPSTR